jgi:predicted branched-subunit amino acid permease
MRESHAMPEPTPPLNFFDRALWRHPACRQGMQDMAHLMPGFGAWGLVTGVAMVQGGLPVSMALLMGLTVFSAGSQLAAVPLMVSGAPLWVIWLTAWCVNLRFVIFSAHTRKHMMGMKPLHRMLAGYVCADLPYVLLARKHGHSPPASVENPEPMAYFCGLVAVNWSVWNVAVVVGVLCASLIPTQWGLGFAGTLALLALLVTLVGDRLSGVSALLAAGVAVGVYALPFKLFIVVAVAAGVAAGLLGERYGASWLKPAAPAQGG